MKLTRYQTIVCVTMMVITCAYLNAQTRLKRFEIVPKLTPVTTLRVDHPDCAVVIVHSAIPNLHFESNMGKIKAQEYRHLESRYVIFLYPEKQRVSIKSPGFVEAEFPMFSELKPRQQFSYEVNEAFDTTGKGDFTLESDPPGADITIEQIPIFSEKTPYHFEQFGAQSYGIRLSKDRYEPLSANILIEANKTQSQAFKLVPQWADLIINSEPTGSSVYVNNALKGTTPLSLSGATSGLDPGDYTIELRPASQFYESFTKRISLRGNSKEELKHSHKDISAYLRVNVSPQPLEVRLNDNIDRTLAMGERIRLLRGSYDIEIINVGEDREYYKPYSESFSLEPQDEKQISLILAINEDMAPTLSHETGTYSAPIKVTFKDSQLSNRQIFYTLDGREPNRSSIMYTSPVLINKNSILKAIAYTGQKASEISSASYSMQVSAPVFTPPAGSFPSPQQVEISSATEGVTIRYTTDGSEPGQNSAQYRNPIDISRSTTLRTKAYKANWSESKPSLANYSLEVAAPTFSPEGGNFTTNQSVTIGCSTPGVIIYYTTDGSEPTTSSNPYNGPISLSLSTTFKAKAFSVGWNSSQTAIAVYTFGFPGSVLIPAGTFTMGRTTGSGDRDELPTHSVSLDSFYMGKYQVTQAEYTAIMGSNPASGFGVGDNYPVYNVNWYSAIKYCNLRSMAEGLTPVYSISGSTNPDNWGSVPSSNNSTWNAAICNFNANGYRLPTEAEWEYAARGTTNDPDYLYSGSDDINAVAWYSGNNSPSGSKPVGTKAPNALGLYDMSGNLYDWCWDWYSSYSANAQSNPTGPASGSYRVTRGGGWSNSAYGCRVAYRGYNYPFFSFSYVGFRLCRAVL